jgi:opacity protein-like surface antigen
MPASEEEEFYVDLTWPEVEGAKNYDLEIYGNEKGTEVILKERVEDNKWRWDNPKLGKFFWKIAAVDSEGQVGESSPLEALFVNFNFKKNFIIRNFTTSIERLRMRVSETPTVKWTWDKVPMVTYYKIRLSYSSSFKNVFFEKNITDNNFSWDATEFSKENPDRAVFMDLVAVYKDSIFSPVEKDRFIVIEKGSYLIKKQIDSSYLVFNYAPSKSTYEISSGTISGNSEHMIPISFQINSGIQLNEKVFIFSALEYKTATFFSDSFSPGIDYQDIGFETQYGRSLYNWRQFGFALSLGLRYNRLTEITATSATLLSGSEKSYVTGILNAFMDQILNDRWAHYAKVGLGAGNLTIINFEYNLKRTLKRSMFANIGAKYMYKSTGGTPDISITDEQIFLGLGWELPF